jgi:electron transfer flavoprotein alpha subunit
MSVLVYTENWEGKFKKLSFELVSYAYAIAKQASTELIAISIGQVAEDELQKLSQYGASKILKVHSPLLNHLDSGAYAKVIASAASQYEASIIVFSNNNAGKGIAPRVAVRMKAGLASGTTALPEKLSPLKVKKFAFTGKSIAYQEIRSENKIICLAQNSFEIIENPQAFALVDFDGGIANEDVKTTVESVDKVTDKLLLSDAEIVVSGGRGMKAPENWGPLEELAEILGAATACSRPVSDEGWRGHEEHVGQTGKLISPNLYFALGISGAIQHLAGVSSSKVIVAVNTDPTEPIFEAADYGIEGDLKDVLPKMVEEARKFKANM